MQVVRDAYDEVRRKTCEEGSLLGRFGSGGADDLRSSCPGAADDGRKDDDGRHYDDAAAPNDGSGQDDGPAADDAAADGAQNRWWLVRRPGGDLASHCRPAAGLGRLGVRHL